ncbi:hypothetical protein ACO0RG_002927 [Hanseniaspora osmophila]
MNRNQTSPTPKSHLGGNNGNGIYRNNNGNNINTASKFGTKADKGNGSFNQAVSDNGDGQLLDDQKAEIYEAFSIFDLNSDGFLDYHELKVAFRALGFDLSKRELLDILEMFGTSSQTNQLNAGYTPSRLIGYDDFYSVAATKILERDPLEEIKRAFTLFDADNKGMITFENLKQVANDLGEKLSDEDIHKMINEFDLDEDGGINEEEFIAICTE